MSADDADDPGPDMGAEFGDQASAEVKSFVEMNDLEGLFAYFLSNRFEIAAVMAAVGNAANGAGDALDALAESYPEHFVGWYDWCADGDIQQELYARQRVAMVIEEQRMRAQSGEYGPN
ncbi:MAG TPA: hypothetical protein VHV76_14995 [Mycobacteriales bacterium]|jgi:hypothetical protein|nr:hypothetical protein [Mycobacteriales bacterium]